MQRAKNIDDYIAGQPEIQAKALKEIRKTVRKIVPEAEEGISYAIPAFELNGKPLVYFAGFPHHIGFYPLPHAIRLFKKELAKYKQGKGSIQFPISAPMPIALITKIVKARQKEIIDKLF